MLNKTLFLEIDKPNYVPIYTVQYDYNSRFYEITILNNSQPLDLTGIRVIVAGKKPDGKEVLNSCKVLDAKKGLIQLELTEQMNAVNGASEYALELFSADGMLSSQPFKLIVTRSTISKSVESSKELGALKDALNEVQDIDNRFAQTNAQLSEIKTHCTGGNGLQNHSHINKVIIDKFSQSDGGELLFDGKKVIADIEDGSVTKDKLDSSVTDEIEKAKMYLINDDYIMPSIEDIEYNALAITNVTDGKIYTDGWQNSSYIKFENAKKITFSMPLTFGYYISLGFEQESNTFINHLSVVNRVLKKDNVTLASGLTENDIIGLEKTNTNIIITKNDEVISKFNLTEYPTIKKFVFSLKVHAHSATNELSFTNVKIKEKDISNYDKFKNIEDEILFVNDELENINNNIKAKYSPFHAKDINFNNGINSIIRVQDSNIYTKGFTSPQPGGADVVKITTDKKIQYVDFMYSDPSNIALYFHLSTDLTNYLTFMSDKITYKTLNVTCKRGVDVVRIEKIDGILNLYVNSKLQASIECGGDDFFGFKQHNVKTTDERQILNDFKIKYADETTIDLMNNIKSEQAKIENDMNELKELVLESSGSVLVGKKWSCMGDSNTGINGYCDTKYHDILKKKYNMDINVTSFGGECWTHKDGYNKDTILQQCTKLRADDDYITVMAGTNDFGLDREIGTFDDRVNTTLYGSLHLTCRELLKIQYQTTIKKLGIIIPVQRGMNSGEGRNHEEMIKYVNVIKEVANHYGIPVLDLYNNGGVCCYESTKTRGYLADKLHLDNEGHLIISNKIKTFLESL